MLDSIMGEDSPRRRLVDEYQKDHETGEYKLVRYIWQFREALRLTCAQ